MRIKRFASIRFKLSLMMLGIVVVALVMTGYVAQRHANTALRMAASSRLQSATVTRQEKLNLWFLNIESEVLNQAKNPFVLTAFRSFRKGWTRQAEVLPDDLARTSLRQAYGAGGPLAQRLDPVFEAAHKRYDEFFQNLLNARGFEDVFLIDPSGNVLYSARKGAEFAANLTSGVLGASALGEVYRQTLDEDGDGVSDTGFQSYAGAEYLVSRFMARPLTDASGNLVGILAFRIQIAPVERILADRLDLGETGSTFLVGADRTLLLGNSIYLRPGQSDFDITPVRRALAGFEGEATLTWEGVDMLVDYAPLTFLGRSWALIVMQSEREIAGPARQLMQNMVRDGLLILAFTAAVALALARSISRPLALIQQAMQQIREGRLTHYIPSTHRRDEIGRIARALAAFRDAMKLNEELALENSFKSAAFESASSAQTLLDRDMRITFANQAFSDLLRAHLDAVKERVPGLDPADVVGTSIDAFHDDPERLRAIAAAEECLPYRVEVAVGDVDFVLAFSVVRSTEGTPIGYVVGWEDVTEERMREAVLEAINTRQVMAEFDMEGQLVTANPAFCNLLGQEFSALKGGALDDLLQPADLAPDLDDIEEAELPGQSRFLTAGTERIMEGGMTTILDRAGIPRRLLLIGQDITRDHARLMSAEEGKEALIREQTDVVEAVTTALSALASGDLAYRIETPLAGTYDALRRDFNAALETLGSAMRTVVENADSIRSEVSEITSAADDLSRRTEHQAATLEETASALDVLTMNLSMAAGEAQQADTVVRKARDRAVTSEGGLAMHISR